MEADLVEAVESHIQPEKLHGRFLIQSPAYFFASRSELRGVLKNRSALLAEQITREVLDIIGRLSNGIKADAGGEPERDPIFKFIGGVSHG